MARKTRKWAVRLTTAEWVLFKAMAKRASLNEPAFFRSMLRVHEKIEAELLRAHEAACKAAAAKPITENDLGASEAA